MTQYVEAKIEKIERPVTAWAVLSIACVLMLAYAYFVNATITNIVAAEEMQSQISEKASEVGNLETELLLARSGIHLEYALSMGFKVTGTDTVYVAKRPLSSLSFNR